MSSVLISGGNGFLGTLLTIKALEEGHDVTVVDDFSTSKVRNIPESATLIRTKIETYSDPVSYDYVVHLAARPSPEDYMENPLDTIMSNSMGTLKMLEIARKGDSVFLFTSSSEVYGDAKVIPTPENYFGCVNPNGIRSCYDESKRFSEALIMAYHRQYDMDVRIERPFNVYGPGIREDGAYGRVIPRFVSQALNNIDIVVHGDGRQTRAFLYIDDWINATWKFLTSKNLKGAIINIGSNDEIPIIDLAKLVIRITKSSSGIVVSKARTEDPTRRAADISLAKNLLNWEPTVGLEKGLIQTEEWLRSKIK